MMLDCNAISCIQRLWVYLLLIWFVWETTNSVILKPDAARGVKNGRITYVNI